MGVTYDVCNAEVRARIDAAMKQYHPRLKEAGVTIDALFAEKIDKKTGELERALLIRGQIVIAKISITPLPDRVRRIADVRLIIDRKCWTELSETRQMAVLDHELEHLELVPEMRDGSHPVAPDGTTRLDDAGRPKLKLRHHDWELTGFRAVVERHAEASAEAAQFRGFQDQFGQLCLFGSVAGKSVADVVGA